MADAYCRSCSARLKWLKTAAGRMMPVDFDTVAEGDAVFDPAKHRSHFATCPNAAKHRRPRGAKR
jgi:hypothetical protein